MSKIHLEILDTKRADLLSKLSAFNKVAYLAGGTALALQLGHRTSVDFDLFVDKPIDASLRRKISQLFIKPDFKVDSSDQITFATQDGISITFLYYYYPLILETIKTQYLPIASSHDIAADKAATLGRRAVWRDYVDLFYLLHEKIITFDEIIKLGKKKFGGEFNEVLFAQQLCYFKDLDTGTPIVFIKKSFTEEEIKTFLEKEVEEYVKKRLKRS